MGVFVAHLAIFMLVARMRMDASLPAPRPKPNFHVAEETLVDAATGEKIVHREISVSTKLMPLEK